jgi:hypothetical protein
VALYLWSLALRLAPRDLVSKANVRKPGPDAIAGREPRNRPHRMSEAAPEAGDGPCGADPRVQRRWGGLSALRVFVGAERYR